MRLIPAIAIAMSLTPVAAGASEAPLRPGGGSLAALTQDAPEWLRPLPIAADDSRLVGEAVSREFPIYLTAGEATRPAKIRLSYLNAISVMPETFRLAVKINDVVVGETALQYSNQPGSVSLTVPAGLLEAGFNSVRVSVRQTHRVDCSLNSTYELWTQVLAAQSGLVFAGTSGEIRDLRDLAAVKAGEDGSVAIRVRTPESSSPSGVGRASRAVQAAVLFGHYANPRVDFASEPGSGPGLDVIVGTATAIRRSMGMKVPGAGPRSQISHNAQDGRVVLIVSGDTEAEVDAAVGVLSEQAAASAPQGPASGLRALKNANGWTVAGGETVTLADLGIEGEPFRGRLQRQSVRLQMPADLLAADYGRVTFAVDAAYASGLAVGSKLLVRVNGTAIANVVMRNAAGDVLNKQLLQLPVSTFKPGLNTVDIEAETPTAGDEKCDLQALTDQRERFLLSGSSQLIIPALGRVGALPNISSIIPGGLTQLSEAGELNIFVPKARHEAIETALTTLAKMASVSRRVTKPAFSFDIAPDSAAHVLAFGAYDDMPEATLRAAGLDPDKIRRVWRSEGSKKPEVTASIPAIKVASIGDQLEIVQGSLKPAADTAPASRSTLVSLLQAPERGTEIMGIFSGDTSLRDRMNSAVQLASGFAADSVRRMGFAKSQETGELPLTRESTLIVAQKARANNLDFDWQSRLFPKVASTTIILGSDPEDLQNSVTTLLTGSSLWHQFVGNAAVYTPGSGTLDTRVSGETLLVPTAALDVQNVRLIAAGWLSRNIPYYLAALLGIFAVMTVLMHRVLRSSGVRE